MNEKYQELLKAYETRKTYDLPEKDQAYIAMNILVCKKAIEDYEFCDPSLLDEYIENNREEATKATVLWLIYYATERLHYKTVKYFSIFTKDFPTTLYFGLAWIRAYYGEDRWTGDYNYHVRILDVIKKVKPEYTYWYDRANLFSLNKFGCTMIGMRILDSPLTFIFGTLLEKNSEYDDIIDFKVGKDFDVSSLLSLLSLRDAKTDNDKHKINTLELALVKYLFVRFPQETITHIKCNGGICKDAFKFPKRILVEAMYNLKALGKFELHNNIADYSADDIIKLDKNIQKYIDDNPTDYEEYKSEFDKAYDKYTRNLMMNGGMIKDERTVVSMISRRDFNKVILITAIRHPDSTRFGKIAESDEFKWTLSNVINQVNKADSAELKSKLYKIAFKTYPEEVVNYLESEANVKEFTDFMLGIILVSMTNYNMNKAYANKHWDEIHETKCDFDYRMIRKYEKKFNKYMNILEKRW